MIEYGFDWKTGHVGWYAIQLVEYQDGERSVSVRRIWTENGPETPPAVDSGEPRWLNPATDAGMVEQLASSAEEAADEAAIEAAIAAYPAKLRDIATTKQYGWREKAERAQALLDAGGQPCAEGWELLAEAETGWKLFRQNNPMRLAAAWNRFLEKRARRDAYAAEIAAPPWVFGGKGE